VAVILCNISPNKSDFGKDFAIISFERGNLKITATAKTHLSQVFFSISFFFISVLKPIDVDGILDFSTVLT